MGGIYKFLALFAFLPFVTPQCTLRTTQPMFKRSVYEFSVDLSRRLANLSEGHFVSSTLSVHSLLTAISLVAENRSLAELRQVLKLPAHPCFVSKYLSLSKQALAADESSTLERKGVFFADKTYVREDFSQKLTASGVCDPAPLSFKDFQQALGQINDIVKEGTNGKIDKVLYNIDLSSFYLLMVDATYFKGMWKTAFSRRYTLECPFYDANGFQTGEVNMMHIRDQFNLTFLDPIQASILELPYGDPYRNFSMLIFLPYEGVNLQTMVNNLNKISLMSVFSQFKKQGNSTVSVKLPRFMIPFELNLRDTLIDMGLKQMFVWNDGDLPGLSSRSLSISSFLQKVGVEVSEGGFTASTVPVGSISGPNFTANRPFFFMIVDRIAEVTLFSGAYTKPSLY